MNSGTKTMEKKNTIEARIWGSHGTWTLNGTTYLRRVDNKYGWVRCNPE